MDFFLRNDLLKIRFEQLLLLAKASPCPRRKVAAIILDESRNVVIADSYNGPPRKAPGKLCAGSFCIRDGREALKREEIEIVIDQNSKPADRFQLVHCNKVLASYSAAYLADRAIEDFLRSYPPIPSGKETGIGCHHAEANAICNAAMRGIAIEGMTIITNVIPCLQCAKLIHHAGLIRLFTIDGTYVNAEGIDYLLRNEVNCFGFSIKENEFVQAW